VIIRAWLQAAPNRLEAEWVLSHLLGLPRLQLPLDREVPAEAFPLAERLASGEPLQYVLGETEFHELPCPIACDPRALIPRPETEELVELALARIPTDRPWRVVDVGTGTGCIALALKHKRPDVEVVAVDTSLEALDLARYNAARCQLDITFVHGNLLAGIRRAQMIVSNPPYISAADIPKLDANVRDHEPHSALDGGPDGLDLIRRLVPQAAAVLDLDGPLLLEIGEGQGPALRDILSVSGFVDIEILNDTFGRTRFAIARHHEPIDFEKGIFSNP